MIKNPYPGKFIVFEGLDGSGKSTQAELLAGYLKEKRVKARLTLEPTQYLIGGLVRSYLAHDWRSTPECLQLLFSADRAYHLDREIIPSLKNGDAVVCDRYFFSTFAYGALECDLDWLIEANRNFILPDLTILLESEPRECIRRMAGERFSVELFEKEEKLVKVRENYHKIAERFEKETDIRIINGDRAIGEIFEEVKQIADNAKAA